MFVCFLCSLFVTSRRAPTPTLFPYTTLFRSLLLSPSRLLPLMLPLFPLSSLESWAYTILSDLSLIHHFVSYSIRHCFQDRKSTRLNSSHTVISYAVFCLKKTKIVIYIHYLHK